MERQRPEGQPETNGYHRLERIRKAIYELSAAHDALGSPEVFEREIELRRRLLPNADSLDLPGIVKTVLQERVRLAETHYERIVSTPNTPANGSVEAASPGNQS